MALYQTLLCSRIILKPCGIFGNLIKLTKGRPRFGEFIPTLEFQIVRRYSNESARYFVSVSRVDQSTYRVNHNAREIRQESIQHIKVGRNVHIRPSWYDIFSTNSLFRVVIVAYLPSEKFLEVSRSSFDRSVNASHRMDRRTCSTNLYWIYR